MEYQNLLIKENDGILVLTINREKALNALNSRTIDELTYFFGTDAPARDSVRGIIITGAGDRSFVAGADIKEFIALGEQGGAVMAKKGQDAFFLIERFNKPVIAAVNGFALGGADVNWPWLVICGWLVSLPSLDSQKSTLVLYPAMAAPNDWYSW